MTDLTLEAPPKGCTFLEDKRTFKGRMVQLAYQVHNRDMAYGPNLAVLVVRKIQEFIIGYGI